MLSNGRYIRVINQYTGAFLVFDTVLNRTLTIEEINEIEIEFQNFQKMVDRTINELI